MDSNLQVNKILPSVLNIFDESHTTKTYLELLKISKTINISLDDEQIMNIEKSTENQSENRNWLKGLVGSQLQNSELFAKQTKQNLFCH